MQQSVRFHARGVVAPPSSPQAVARGAVAFRRHCEQCHGGPGVSQGVIGMSMQPVPGPLVDTGRRWKPREMYWVIANGIKMSGMPAWGFHLQEAEIWDIVAFLGVLPGMAPKEYQAAASAGMVQAIVTRETGQAPDRARGRVALTQYACQSCHMIPGVTGPQTFVGPNLDGLAQRSFIAGKLPRSEANLVRWIMAPQEVKPGTAMPQLSVSERDARDIAAYLLQAGQ
ncbi:c-type cytochrome [Pseudoduganella sp. OTU4001]|uniref:c-type cytochrome n=1 Tax=Pseudoduganella sp. OTU4001 TaxID=3043854 RepID=UPI00313DB791